MSLCSAYHNTVGEHSEKIADLQAHTRHFVKRCESSEIWWVRKTLGDQQV